MKINFPVRMKNIWFWVGLLGVILSAMGVSPEMFTSWESVFQALRELVSNPYMLGCVVMAVLGVLTDPTTKGISDSKLAMTYEKPKEG